MKKAIKLWESKRRPKKKAKAIIKPNGGKVEISGEVALDAEVALSNEIGEPKIASIAKKIYNAAYDNDISTEALTKQFAKFAMKDVNPAEEAKNRDKYQ